MVESQVAHFACQVDSLGWGLILGILEVTQPKQVTEVSPVNRLDVNYTLDIRPTVQYTIELK